MKKLNRIFLVAMIIWMAVIFLFSMKSGNNSAETSNSITDKIIDLFLHNYHGYDIEYRKQIYDKITFLVRKTAHFGEYGILGLLGYGYILTRYIISFNKDLIYIWKDIWLKVCIITQLLASLYAISDELHQSFVPDRNPAITDVLIDSAGAFSIILFITIIINLIVINKSKKELSTDRMED